MSIRSLLAASCLGLAVSTVLLAASSTGARAAELSLERGRYLVTRVGMCADCHGPGLRGANLAFLAPGLPPAVARKAPRIAGLPQLSSAQAVNFFQSGLLPNGRQARPPMPAFRLRADDARAVTAYLKSLP